MSGEMQKRITIPQLNIQISGDFEAKVLKTAVQYRKEGKSPIGRNWRSFLKARRVEGFSLSPHKAPDTKIISLLQKDWLKNDDVFALVVVSWLIDRKSLVQGIQQWLDKNPEHKSDLESQIGNQQEVYLSIAQKFVHEYPDYSEEDVYFTVAASQTIKVEFTDSDNPDNFESTATETVDETIQRTENLLMYDSDLPSNASLRQEFNQLTEMVIINLPIDFEEEEIDAFLKVLKERINQVIQTRNKENIKRFIDEKLSELRLTLRETSDYFDFTSFEDWQVSQIPESDLESILQIAEELQKTMQSHAELRKMTPKSRQERKKIDEDLDIIEVKIEQLYRALESFFDKGKNKDNEITLESQASDGSESTDEGPAEYESRNDLDESIEEKPETPSKLEESMVETEQSYLEDSNHQQIALTEDDQISEYSLEDVHPDSDWEDEPDNQEGLEEIPPAEEEYKLQRSDEQLSKAGEDDLVTEPAEIDTTPLQENEANQFLIKRILEGNLPRAYWLSLVMEQHNMTPEVPSWLIAGIQGCYWLIERLPSYPSDLLEEIREIASPKNHSVTDKQSVWALNLGICMSLLEQKGLGWEEWLTVDIPSDLLLNLVSRVEKFVGEGNTFDKPVLENVLNKGQIEQKIKEVVDSTKKWLEYAPNRRTRFKGADEVWKEIVKVKSPSGEESLIDWLKPVIQDDRKEAQRVKEAIESKWKNRRLIDDYIQRLFRQMKSNKRFTIEGEPRNQLIRMVGEAVNLADEWCNLVLSGQLSKDKEWLLNNTGQLVDYFRQQLYQTLMELDRLIQNNKSIAKVAAYKTLYCTLCRLAVSLKIGDIGNCETYLTIPYDDSLSLVSNLAKDLILCPPLPLEDAGKPVLEEFQLEHLSILARANYTPITSHSIWVNHQDYRFLEILQGMMPEEEAMKQKEEANLSLEEDCRKLDSKAEDTQKAIEQALLDGLLNEGEHNTFISNIESVRKLLSESRGGVVQPNLKVQFDRLNEIEKKIENKHKSRKEHLLEKWEQTKTYLPQIITEPYQREEVARLIEQNLEYPNLRVVNEIISELDSALQGKPFSLPEFLNTSGGKVPSILNFNDEHKKILYILEKPSNPDSLVESLIGQKRLPQDRKKEVKEAIYSWFHLKSNHMIKDEQKSSHLYTILRYLGFEEHPTSALISIQQPLPKFEWYILSLRPRTAPPVPQFGSLRVQGDSRSQTTKTDYAHYDIVLIWDRPGRQEIESFANKINKRPAILLYFGRMLPPQRQEFNQLSKSWEIPFLLIDDILIAYLSGEYDVRLRAMFECTLPYAYVNPYVPFATGSVPSEMFFGRENEIDRLIDPYGPAIVYGGRQLGKSALLRQVQKRFTHSDARNIAIYEDIRLIGTVEGGQDYRQELLGRLVEALRREDLLDRNRNFDDFSKLANAIIEKVKEKNLRLLLLLDESDNFLEADSGKDFQVVTHLKRAMDQTDRRFKVIFAGLHHVQRFKNIPNQPLSHLGDAGAIEVGPLEPRAAFDLIRKPLQSLGYLFGDSKREDLSLILLILSYTNYHPGLLQLFGHNLVAYLSKKGNSGQPPYWISRNDINAIYRNPKVREIIKDRFNITLKLDERYEAIALSLIVQQWDEQNGFDRLYTPEELYSICRDDWKAGFEEVSMDRFKGFLEEMRGLGVLSVHYQDGNVRKYRLRSPNLVSLMGTRDQILDRLAEISQSEVTSQKRKLESYRTYLNPYYSPLTRSQESAIRGTRSGVCLVFGTPATNLSALSSALEQITEQAKGKFKEIRVASGSGEAIQNDLEKLLNEHRDAVFLIALRDLEGFNSDEILSQIKSAVRVCRQNSKNQRQRLRVVFQFGPFSTREWFNLSAQERIRIEQDEVDVVLNLLRWDKVGIQQILERHEPEEWAVSERSVRKILEVSGGWPTLVDKLIEFGKKVNDVEKVCQNLKDYISDETNRNKFFDDLGIVEPIAKEFISNRLSIGEKIGENELQEESTEAILEVMEFEQAWVVEYLRRLSILGNQDHFPVETFVAKLWKDVYLQ